MNYMKILKIPPGSMRKTNSSNDSMKTKIVFNLLYFNN